VLPTGALIFVTPDQFEQVRQELNGKELRPFHVIITSRFESDLDDALTSLPYRKRPREKVAHREGVALHITSKTSETSAMADEMEIGSDAYELCESRTFLCWAPRLRNANTVVQSTTEALSRGTNPRRRV